MRGHWVKISLAMATAAGLLIGTGLTAAPASASGSPIKIALITSLTGEGASEYAQAPAGFYARIDLQNAMGGVNGHMIDPIVINDQTSPTTVVTGVQRALSEGVTGIVSDTALFFLAAKYPEQAGIPVTGAYIDGPEWGEKPYTNMFASDNGSVNPKYPVNTLEGEILKDHGAAVLGTYGYSISPSSSRAAISTARAFEHLGGTVGVLDTSLPFGTVDFTTQALVAKQKHVDAIVPNLDDNSNFALATAIKQAGVHLKTAIFPTGYEPDVIHSTVWNDVQGDYFITEFRPFQLPNNGTRQMLSALEKYQHFTSDEFPNLTQYESWVGADLMIKGLQMAGKNPTSSEVIKKLRSITSYNANGLLPQSIDYSTIFGHDPAKECAWVLQAQKSGFIPVSSQPTCGTDIPGTSTASAS
jgi:branched-chain amino acid transport system substrate-binding protein